MGISFSKMPPKLFCYIKWPANTLEFSAPAFTDSLETAQAVSDPCLSSLSSYVHMSAARFGFLWWTRALYLHICSLYMKYMLFLPLQSSLGKSPSVTCEEISTLHTHMPAEISVHQYILSTSCGYQALYFQIHTQLLQSSKDTGGFYGKRVFYTFIPRLNHG